jgi:hypothetical protein
VGRDYSTVAAWIATALPADLTATGANNSYEADLYADSEFVQSVRNILSGNTTDATHTITITTGAGQSFIDHANKLTNPLIYNAANGVGIRSIGGYENEQVFSVSDDYVTFSKLQMASGGGHNQAFLVFGSNNNQIDRCILQQTGNGYVCQTAGSLIWRNCLLVTNGNITGGTNGAQKFYNCTFASIPHATYGFVNGYGGAGLVFENCAIFNVDNAVGGNLGFPVVYTNCMTDAASPATGWTGGLTYANQFANVTSPASADFRAKAGADLLNAGVTDTTNIPTAADIVGTARPQGSAWDVGCWELIMTAPSTVSRRTLRQRTGSRA